MKDQFPNQVDTSHLLALALDECPPADLPERVMALVALLATGVEWLRLVAEVPLEAAAVHLVPQESAEHGTDDIHHVGRHEETEV